MKGVQLKYVACVLFLIGSIACNKDAPSNDNDFADFEDFDSDDDFITVSVANDNLDTVKNIKTTEDMASNNDNVFQSDDDDSVDSEFDHFTDEEEFEGFNTPLEPILDKKTGEPKLTVAKVPLHFGWEIT